MRKSYEKANEKCSHRGDDGSVLQYDSEVNAMALQDVPPGKAAGPADIWQRSNPVACGGHELGHFGHGIFDRSRKFFTAGFQGIFTVALFIGQHLL